jgi:Amt family ammonium transporter
MGGFFGHVALTTNLAAAAGGLAALIASWLYFGKSDIPAMLNGVLAALVAITGACAFVEPWAAILIGFVAGAFTFMTSQWLERAGLDDPIYAFSVHGIAGMWGAISTGLFATPELVETVGVGKAGLFYGGGLHQLGVQVAWCHRNLCFRGSDVLHYPLRDEDGYWTSCNGRRRIDGSGYQ